MKSLEELLTEKIERDAEKYKRSHVTRDIWPDDKSFKAGAESMREQIVKLSRALSFYQKHSGCHGNIDVDVCWCSFCKEDGVHRNVFYDLEKWVNE